MRFDSDINARLTAAYARCRDGDPTGSSEMFDLLENHFECLLNKVRATFTPPKLADEWDVWDALCNSLSRLADGTSDYDPARGSVVRYVVMEARGDVKNANRSAARRRARERKVAVRADSVADGSSAGNRGVNGASDVLEAREWEQARLDQAVAQLTPRDGRYLRAIAAGADEAALTRELGLCGTPEPQRRRELKRTRDRVRLRLKRAGLIEESSPRRQE